MGRLQRFGAVLAVAGLAACDGARPPGPSLATLFEGSAPAVPQLALHGGDVLAVGPNGYCADPDASSPAKGFAIFASCAALGADVDKAALAGVATVQAGAIGSAIVAHKEEAFEAFLLASQGAATLSRANDPDTVEVQSTLVGAGAVSVRFTDTAPSDVAGEQALQWRAFVDIGGRLVTISVRGLKEAPLERAAGSTMLRQALAALIATNAAPIDGAES